MTKQFGNVKRGISGSSPEKNYLLQESRQTNQIQSVAIRKEAELDDVQTTGQCNRNNYAAKHCCFRKGNLENALMSK